jgi:hypothetical protein
MEITQEMIDAQNKRLHDGLADVSDGIAALKADRDRLRAGLERARGAIQTLSSRLPAGDFAAQHIVDEELKLATQALHPH